MEKNKYQKCQKHQVVGNTGYCYVCRDSERYIPVSVNCDCGKETLVWVRPSKFHYTHKTPRGYAITHEKHEEYLAQMKRNQQLTNKIAKRYVDGLRKCDTCEAPSDTTTDDGNLCGEHITYS